MQIAAFAQPPSHCRPMPFWFWNAAMEPVRIVQQVQAMATAGCGGFYIHPRQGLSVPYLSERFFERVRLAVATAQACGLTVWLYDEYPYPSGVAGGLVLTEPALRLRDLHLRQVQGQGRLQLRAPLGRVLLARAAPLVDGRPRWDAARDLTSVLGVVLAGQQFWRWRMDHCPYNEKRFLANDGELVLDWDAPPGHWQVLVATEAERGGFKYFDGFVDTLAPGAAESFLQFTHERYAQHLGQFFGQTIPGIFTDETEPSYWSPHLATDLAAHGWPLERLLPALADPHHPEADQARYARMQRALALFTERWELPIRHWCESHSLRWVAEKPTWRPAQFGIAHQPAIDAGHVCADRPATPLPAQLRHNPRAARSAAEQAGHGIVHAESFHSLGWGATLLDQRWSCDWLAAQGVSHFIHHAFYASTTGLAKHDAPPSFFLGTTAWPHWRLLADHIARLSLTVSGGQEVAPLALLHPTTSCWCDGPVNAPYEQLLNALVDQHIGFHIVDGELLQAGPGRLNCGRCQYQALVVPPLSVAGPHEEAAIRTAVSAGVSVWLAGPVPTRRVGHADPAAWSALPGVRALVMSELPRSLQADFDSHGVWLQHRRDGPQQFLLVANTRPKPCTGSVTIPTDETTAAAWCLDSGQRQALPTRRVGDQLSIDIRLPAFAAQVVVLGDTAPAEPPGAVIPLELRGPWTVRRHGPNALRLDAWRAAVGGDWASPATDEATLPVVPALPLRWLDYGRSLWQSLGNLPPPRQQPLWLRCWFEVSGPALDLALLIEDRAIVAEQATIYLDGTPCSAPWVPTELIGGDRCTVELGRVGMGRHLLALRLDGVPDTGGLVTPLHLLGDFSLGHDGATLMAPITRTDNIGLKAIGAPHCPGAVTYSRELPTGLLAGATALELPDTLRDAVNLTLNGQDLGVRAWPPYRWPVPADLHGTCQLELTIAGTLLGFFEGRQPGEPLGP